MDGVEIVDPLAEGMAGKCFGTYENVEPCVRCQVRVQCEQFTKKVAVQKPLPPKKNTEDTESMPKPEPIDYLLELFNSRFDMKDVSKDKISIYTFWTDGTPVFQMRYVKSSKKFLIATPDKSTIIQLPELKSIRHALDISKVIVEAL